MADEPQQQPVQNPPADPPQDDAETAFWAKLDEHLNGWWEKKNPKPEPKDKDGNPPLGKSRTGGKRVTLSTLFADAVFGPPKPDHD